MITYDYHCDANNTTITVRHSIKDSLKTWGELCELAELDPGNTPPETPVRRLLGGGSLLLKGEKAAPPMPKKHGGGRCGCC